jgi:dolichol-phosphate mannosyltransferase
VLKVYPWLKFEILQRKGAVRNYGALIRFGMAYSISRYVVAVSAYGDDDISLILTMLNKVRKGAQLVQVTRYANVADASRVSWRFRFYQSLYRRMTKLALGMDISDSTYGFKMFDRVFVQALGLTQNGYSISPEITFKTLLAGGKVEYVSSSIKSTPFNKDFKLRREGLGYLWLLIQGVAHKIGILWF